MKLIFYFFLPFFLFSNFEENILKNMSLDEKIGILFMVPISTLREDHHKNDIIHLIKNYKISNFIICSADALSLNQTLAKLNKISTLPMFIAADAEWGTAMRIKNEKIFPKNYILKNFENKDLFYIAEEIAINLKNLNIHLNLAPVVDIGKKNDYIYERSFGDNKNIVFEKALNFVNAHKKQNVFTCLKHYPGIGETNIDPHFNLPISHKTYEEILENDLFVYKKLIENNIKFIMSSHILLKNIDDLPATLSKKTIDILRNELFFKGIIITDALNMQALKNNFPFEKIILLAHLAGNDILLFADHRDDCLDDILKYRIPNAFNILKNAYLNNEININYLNEKVLKILKIKYSLNK
ncbi:MAG: hypothetical protein A3F40_00770 [Chlamydiae bacterium RIFCSPHIGHO2_12_FULL_27_8]|nr:MAG: hypothetical protein A3F40_00770 [Chlamydiae bacterium RIFCSPHIGHO2_12_FULL_27_8]